MVHTQMHHRTIAGVILMAKQVPTLEPQHRDCRLPARSEGSSRAIPTTMASYSAQSAVQLQIVAICANMVACHDVSAPDGLLWLPRQQ